MEEYYPYSGLTPYTGNPDMLRDSAGNGGSSSTRSDEAVPLPCIAEGMDYRRLDELDIDGDGEYGAISVSPAYREELVAYCHDPRRVSPHPLGIVSAPAGVENGFWKAFEAGRPVVEKPEPEAVDTVAAAEPVADTGEREVRAPRPVKARPVSSGGGRSGKPPVDTTNEEEERHDPTEMPFLDHLEELRWTILKVIIVIVIAMIGSWYLSDWFYSQVTELSRGGKSFIGGSSVTIPLAPRTGHEGNLKGVVTDAKTGKGLPFAAVSVNPGNYAVTTDSTGKFLVEGVPPGSYTVSAAKNGYTTASKTSGMKLVMTTVMEPLIIRLQMALVMGLILALPLVLYFIWSFVSPGLYQNEKQWVMPLIFASTGCFFAGASLAWFIIVPWMLQFLQTFMPPDIDGMFTFGKFLGIILKFTLSFGVMFELPMVAFVLAKIGILKYKLMTKYRGYALVLVFITSAIITPTVDPISQTLMAIPLYLLYEISIAVAWFAGRKTIM